jgi:hypothetical protein
MSDKPAEININGGPGCLFFFAAIIIGIAIGNLYGVEHGWLAIGGVLIFWGILGTIAGWRK